MSDLVTAIREAAKAIRIEPRDHATLDLAITYAQAIDNGGDLDKLGPALLRALEALAMTPKSRMAVVKGGVSHDGSSIDALDELRERRRSRADRAANLDAAAT